MKPHAPPPELLDDTQQLFLIDVRAQLDRVQATRDDTRRLLNLADERVAQYRAERRAAHRMRAVAAVFLILQIVLAIFG